MDLITQTEAAKRIGVSVPAISRYIREGKIKKHAGKKVDYDELVAYKKIQHEGGVTDDGITYHKARTHKEAFRAKLAELEYKEKMGQLAPVSLLEDIMDQKFAPISKAMDNLASTLKAMFPDTPDDAIEWLQEEINNIKMAGQDATAR